MSTEHREAIPPVEEHEAVAPEPEPVGEHTATGPVPNMIPARERRRTGVERLLVRVVATAGIIGIAVLLGAILGSQDVAGWIIGLVVGLVSVILAAILWSSRQV
jgi:hypothetical protein